MSPSWGRSRGRTSSPALPVARGEKVLASAEAADGTVFAGTRDAFYVAADGETRRVPWEEVEAADWDRDTDTFRLSEVGSWGDLRPVHTATLADPGRLLELVRERVTASVVLQRHVPVAGRRGLRVIARRAPSGSGGVQWVYEYDEGVDPDDETVREAAREALEVMRRDVGLP
ncbi:hypothetical protein SAMN05192575_10324 [Nocardioides alpinus]|uniref:Uncharacterized protein n=1 Tax=Nocardioides alpinus TaxID=748909 RepID=A0A1I0XUN4_9ACTN|nr:hypothetical protein [Nocardioides alpinus]PKH42848.1 hypothetical protein CXG46_06225 [Nocardioides alpinus]SFB04634.1 hypothetical protein SAMN05192575_10324 [Nocardioides alpinus]